MVVEGVWERRREREEDGGGFSDAAGLDVGEDGCDRRLGGGDGGGAWLGFEVSSVEEVVEYRSGTHTHVRDNPTVASRFFVTEDVLT